MEWSELKISQIFRYGFIYPKHRFLCYLSTKTNKNLVSKPLGITLIVTGKCNLRCKMCCYWKKKFDDKELSEEEVLRIITDIKEWGVNRLNLSGGEPLLRKNIVFKALSLCQEYGIETGLVTNGWLLDQQTADKLVSLGLGRVSISVDGLEVTHDKIRGAKGSFDKAISAISAINKSNNELGKNCVVHLNSVVCNDNLDELLDLVDLAERFNSLLWLQVLHCYDADGTLIKDTKNPLWVPKERLNKLDEIIDKIIEIKRNKKRIIGNPTMELKFMKKYFRDPVMKRDNCYAAFDAMSIDSFGNVLPCWHWQSVGNIKEMEGVRYIWNSEEYKNALIKMQRCPLPCLLNCHFTPGSLGSLMYDLVYISIRRRLMR